MIEQPKQIGIKSLCNDRMDGVRYCFEFDEFINKERCDREDCAFKYALDKAISSERERIKKIIKSLPKGYVDKEYVSVCKEKELLEMIDDENNR